MAKQRDLKASMGGLFARTEPQEQEPPAAAIPEQEPAPEQADPILDALELELRRRGLTGRDLDMAITAFAVARATEKADRDRQRSRRDWSRAAQEHGKPQTFRLWDETIQRLDALMDHHPDKLKRDVVNALLAFALDAAEAGEMDLSDL